MSHMFGNEYDELIDRARLGSAYDNQLSDIAEERLPAPGRKRGTRKEWVSRGAQVAGGPLQGAYETPAKVGIDNYVLLPEVPGECLNEGGGRSFPFFDFENAERKIMEKKKERYINQAISRYQHFKLQLRDIQEQVDLAYTILRTARELCQVDSSFLETPVNEPLTREWWRSRMEQYKKWEDQQLAELK